MQRRDFALHCVMVDPFSAMEWSIEGLILLAIVRR